MFFEVDAKITPITGDKEFKEKYLVKAETVDEAAKKVLKVIAEDRLEGEITSSKMSTVRKVIEQ